MRQGEIVPPGKWTGPPVSGVASPRPLVLPDPTRRFAATAKRLARLAPGNPAESWLCFVEQLAWGQHEAATACRTPPALNPASVEASVAARLPPLTADRGSLDPCWRLHLAQILDCLCDRELPGEARSILEDLRSGDPEVLDSLAEAFLHDAVPAQQIGPVLYITAALQVHFTLLAAHLPADALRLLPQRGLCPCCGSTPIAGVVTASGTNPGLRYLHCSLCSTAWNHVRAVCVNCGEAGKLSLRAIEGQAGPVKAETCGHCGTYSKLFYERDAPGVDAVADDLATLALDVLVGEAGWSRHAPNPLFLVA